MKKNVVLVHNPVSNHYIFRFSIKNLKYQQCLFHK